jgi:hypothetical protein
MLPVSIWLLTLARFSPMPTQLNGRAIVKGRPYGSCAPRAALVMAAIALAWLVERRGEALKIEVHRGVRECE